MGTPRSNTSVASKVAVIALTAVLYTVAKGITGFIPSPWGVGQLYIAVFVPIFLATVSETIPVAIGAAMGSFIGDVIFLYPAGGTTPALALAAGVPANFIGILVFGWMVKRYKSWTGFITAAVASITLGNAIAAALVASVGPYLFLNLASLTSLQGKVFLTIGLTVFWDSTAVPVTMLLIPALLRAVKPLIGRSTILSYYPSWSGYEVRNLLPVSVAYAIAFVAVGALYFFTPLGDSSLAQADPIKTLIFVAVAAIAVVGPTVGLIAGTRKNVGSIGG